MGLGARSPGALFAALSLLLVSCGEGREAPDGDVDVAEVLGDLFDLFDLSDETEVPDLETSDQDQVEDHSDEGGDGDLSTLNRPPVIEILAPVDGAVFAFGERVSLSAIVSDDFDPPTALGVEWSSPIQGVIFVGSPDGDGQVEVVAEDLVIGRHRLEVTAVDSEGAEANAAVDIAVSAEDGAPVLRIVPAAPLTRDELTAEVVDPMLEAGVGGLEVEWAWFRGAEPMGSGATIDADATTKGETWRVLGVVKNGVEVTPPGVAQVTIGNTAPRCVGALGFDVDSQAKALTCRCDARVDEDEADPVADRCAWTVAGAPFETEGACRLEWEGMAAGTRIGCELTPFDGDDEGGAVQTSSATEFVVPDAMGNTPPTTPGVALAPRFGNATDRFVCEVVSPSQDAQGDAVSYAVSWSVNGHWVVGLSAATVVPASELVGADGARAHDGDVIACRVVASDGVLQSAAGTSNEVRLGTVGVSVGELGDVVLDEVLGDGCFRDGEVALPSCAEDLFCSVAVTACFDENGALEGAPVVSAVVELPGLGTVVMEGEAGAQGGEGWCITGHPADLGPPVVPLPLSGLTLTACSGPDGVTSSLSGRVTLDGEVHPFVDAPFESVLVGQGADGFILRIEIPLPAFRIGGTRFGGAISIATGERSVGFEGFAELEGVGADGRVALEGQWQAAGGVLVSGTLSAGLGLSVAGLSFAGEAALSLDGGVWRLELEDGAMTLPGGHELSLSGAIEVVAGRLVEAELDAGAGVSFAGVEFSGDALVRWSSAERRFSLELAGGMLGPEGPSFDLSGSVVLEDGVVVAGALTAGADLAVGGVQFAGDAVVSWEDDTMFVGLAAGVVGLPGGADLSLAGELTLVDGTLADASFVGSGSASVEGVRFGGEVSASWSGGAGWSLGLSDGRLSLPGGDELTLSGSLTVVGGRVVSGSFAAGADLSFAGIAFSGAASASYRVERDDLGSVVSERLALGLSGGRLSVAGSGELTLSGEVEIEDGAVASAVFEAGTDLAIGDVRFAGAARVEYTAPGRLELVVSGGQVEVAGATLVVGGRIGIEDGGLTCGELEADAAVSAQLGGVSFGLGLRYARAGTCMWRDGTTTVSEAPRFVVSLREGRLSVGPATLTLAGNATLVDGALACAELEATGGAAVAVGGVSFAAGARYAAAGQRCAWSESDGVGELELTLRRGVVQVAGQSVSLSGAAVLGGGAIVSAAFAGEAALEVPGAGAAFGVEGSYVAATNGFSLRLAGGRVAMAGATFTFEGQGEVVGGQVGCLIFETSAASPAVAVIGESALEVGARMAGAGFQCAWMEGPAEVSELEVTLSGNVVIAGASSAFSGAGKVVGGEVVCAELAALGEVVVPIGEARFDVGVRYAAAGASCVWGDGTETEADAPTLLASLKNGEVTLGDVSLSLSGTGELAGGELTCAELRADGGVGFEVGGVSFRAGARYAAAGYECGWSEGLADTLEATLHEGAVAVAGASIVLSGEATIEGGAVRCASLVVESTGLAFGGVEFEGVGRYVAPGANCGGASEGLSIVLDEGRVDVGGTTVVLEGSGAVVDGALGCVTFAATGQAPVLEGLTVEVGGRYARAGVSCGGEVTSEDTFALTLAASAGPLSPLSMDGLGRIEGGALACAELNARGEVELAGVSFDVGGRYVGAGRSCEWADGTSSAAEAATFIATLRDGTLSVGGQTLVLSGEGELREGRVACATLDALGAASVGLGGVSFEVGARYAAAGESCGWSDGSGRLELTLREGVIAVGASSVTLSGQAELSGGRFTCATLRGEAGSGFELGGVGFEVGARYAAAGEACGWSDGGAARFELTLEDGELAVGDNVFTLSGAARLDGGVVSCAELGSTGQVALGGTAFAVGARFVGAGRSCVWSDGSEASAAANGSGTFSVYLSGGSVTVAGVTLGLSGSAVARGGRLACAELEASSSVDFEVGGVGFEMGGARYLAAGETCVWADGTSATADQETFRLALRDGVLFVGAVRLTLSGMAEIAGGAVTCADVSAGGGVRLDVGGVRFAAGARFAAQGHACGWSDGARDVLQVTLDDGSVDVGGVAVGLRGAAEIASGRLTCADFDVTSGAEVAFGGVRFVAGARFAAQGESCGWSDGAQNRLEVTLEEGSVDVGTGAVSLSGGGVVVGGRLACASLSAGGRSTVGGLAFDVTGRFAAAGQRCEWAAEPAVANTFELSLTNGSMQVGATRLSLSGAGRVVGGRLTCAELDAAGGATADVGGVSFELGARYVAADEACVWADGSRSEAVGAGGELLVALKDGALAVGGQTLNLSGVAVLRDGQLACATLDAVGAASVELLGIGFEGGARYAAAGAVCPWSDGPVASSVFEVTLSEGTFNIGSISATLSGAARVEAGRLVCGDFEVASAAGLSLGGVALGGTARYSAAGSDCGWSDGSERLEVTLDGAIEIGQSRVALRGMGQVVDRELGCVAFEGLGQAALGGVSFEVGARFTADGAACEWGEAVGDRFEVTLSGGSVPVDGVAIGLAGSGLVEGGRLSCAELGSSVDVSLGGVAFEVGARFASGGASCTWSDGTRTEAEATTFTLALMDGSLQVGDVALTLSGSATLAGGQLTCAELASTGSLSLAGVSFAAGARYSAANRACTWRDGTTTTSDTGTLALTLYDGALRVGPASVVLSGTATIANATLTCATFAVAGSLELGGIRFDGSARYAGAGQTCGWPGRVPGLATLELELREGGLDLGGVSVGVSGRGTVAGGELTCASFEVASGAAVGLGGVSFSVGARYAAAHASCGGVSSPTSTFELTLDEGRLAVGPATLTLAGTARVAGGRLTCAELDAVGGATVDLAGVAFSAGARFATAGSSCTWSDGTSTEATANALMLALRDGTLTVGPTTLTLSGAATLFGNQIACAELDAAGAAQLDLAGVAFDAGARYAGTGHVCVWADGTTRPAGPRALMLALRDGALAVGANTLTLAGTAELSSGRLTCAELQSSGMVDVAGVGFSAGARYLAANSSCTWRDGTTGSATAARLDLALHDGRLALGTTAVTLAGSATLVGTTVACAELRSTGQARHSLAGIAFELGARYGAKDQVCPWGTSEADTLLVTLDDGVLDVDGNTLTLSGTAEVADNRLTCASFTSGASLPVGGVTFRAGARYTAANSTCEWASTARPTQRLELTLDDGTLSVGPDTLTLSGAATLDNNRLTCAELDATGTVALAGVQFDVGARFAAGRAACVFSGEAVAPSPTSSLWLTLREGRVSVGSNTLTLAGSATLANNALACAELDANVAVAVAGLGFDAGARFARAEETCVWRDGTTTAARTDTFVLTLRDGALRVGATELWLAGQATLTAGSASCIDFAASAAQGFETPARATLDGVSFDVGARFTAAEETCAWTTTPSPTDRLELTLSDGELAIGPTRFTLSGAATLEGSTLTCAELDADGDVTVSLANTTFDVGARYAAAHHVCVWSDGTTSAPTSNTLAVRLAGELTVAGQSMAVSGNATLERGALTCAELAATAASSVELGGVSFETGARYTAAGTTCTWSDGTSTTAATSFALDLALRNGLITMAGQALRLSGKAAIADNTIASAELAVSLAANPNPAPTPVALSGVTFDASAQYLAATDTLILTLADGRLEAGLTTLTLTGSATIDTATKSVRCLDLSSTGSASADFAGVTFDVGARYAAAGATCAWNSGAPALAPTFEATLENGTLTLPDGSVVTVRGVGTIVAGRISCATLSATGQVGTADGLGFDGTARYAAQGEACGWRDPAGPLDRPAITVDLRSTLTIGDNVLTLSGAGSLDGSTLTCVELETTGDVALAGVAFTAHARFVGTNRACLWSDGTTSEPGPSRLEVVLDEGTVSLGDTSLHLTGLAIAEETDTGYAVPCMGFDARANSAWPLGGLSFDAAVHFSDAGAQCPWDIAPAMARTLTLALDDGALTVGSTTASLAGSATITDARVDCLELAAGSDVAGLADLTFDLGARYAAANATCTWSDQTSTSSPTASFQATLGNGTLTVGAQSVALSGSATVEDATITCAELEAAGDFSVELVETAFSVDARYAAANAICPWRDTPPVENTFTLALSGDLEIDGTTATFTGDAELEGTRLTCATLTTDAQIPLGGLTASATARYASPASTCGWNTAATERLQLGLDTALNLGSTTATLSGFADLESGRLTCAELVVGGDTTQAFGGVAMSGRAHYAAANTTCTFTDSSTASGTFDLALSGDATIGATSVGLRASTTLTGPTLTCLDFEAALDARLDGATFDVAATWAAPDTACGEVPAAPTSTLTAHLDGTFAVGPTSVAVSGSGLIVERRLQCLDFAADGDVTLPLGSLEVAMAARFAARNATCTWGDGTASNPTTDTLFAALSGELAVGANVLALSGNGLIANGQVACAELAADGDLPLGGVTFDAGARYAAADRACTWSDNTTWPAPASATLKVSLDDGAVRVGPNTITLRGEAELDQATGLTCATFAVDGDVALAGVTFAASAAFAARDRDCGAWDTTSAETFRLAVTDGSLRFGDNLVTVTGNLDVENRNVTNGTLDISGNIALAGLAITPRPATKLASLVYTASYGPNDTLTSQALTASLAGRVTVSPLGAFDVDANASIEDGALQSLRLALGADLVLAGATVEADTIALDYQRNPSSLELLVEGGRLAITGLGTLEVAGRTRLVNGSVQTLSLEIGTDLELAGLTLSGGASLLYTASPSNLILAVDQASATVAGLGSLSLSGQALLTAGVLDTLSLAASGALSIANVAITGQTSLEFQRVDPITLSPSLHLALTGGRLTIAPFGNLQVSGELAIAESTLQSFALDLASTVDLAGLRLSGGLSLAYSADTATFRFAVDEAGATVIGLGHFTVSGETAITSGRLASFSLTASGALDLDGVAVGGDLGFAYTALPLPTLSLVISDGRLTIAGLGALSVAGSSSLQAGRLTQLSLAITSQTSFLGVALTGASSLDYRATFDALGTLESSSLALSVDEATLALPEATVALSGSLRIDDGQVTCATFGPASVTLSNLDFTASAAYIAAGQTCGVLATPATAASFRGAFATTVLIGGRPLSVSGEGLIANGTIDTIALGATVDLSAIAGLESAFIGGSYRGGTICLDGAINGELTLPLGVELRRMSAGFCATGPAVSALNLDLHLIVPNLVGEPLPLLATAAYTGASALTASLCLAGSDNDGAACCAGTTQGCSAADWQPFSGGLLPGLPDDWANLTVDTLAGSVSVGGATVSIDAIGIIDGSQLPPLVPGLVLEEVAVSLAASVGRTTAASAGVRGLFSVPLGEQPIDVHVAGEFELGGGQGLSLSLSGGFGDRDSGVSADVEPLRDFIGPDIFELTYFEVEVAASTSQGVSFTLAGGANISLPAPVSVGPLGLQVEGHGQLGKRTGFYLIGAICGLTLPANILPEGFDAIPLGEPSPCEVPTLAVALASRAYPEVFVAPNTPLRRGLTLAGQMAAPRGILAPLGLAPMASDDTNAPAGAPGLPGSPLFPEPPSIVAELSLDTTGLRLKGALNFPWQLIRPDWNLPAIRLLQFDEFAFEVLIKSPPILQFTGSVLFEPNHCIPDYQSFIEAGLASNDDPFKAFDPTKITCLDLPAPFRQMPQQEPLRGSATFRYAPPNELGGEIAVNGIWYEPFWIPNVAVANPGFRLGLRITPTPAAGIPVPLPFSFGVNGDFFWKRPYYDDASADPVYPIACHTDGDCTGFGTCANGACPARCIDGPDGDTLPDTCSYIWPYTCANPDPEAPPGAPCINTLEQPAEVPASLSPIGMTFFYDIFPSVSGILIPLPTFIVRGEHNQINTLDLIPALDELRVGARNLMRWAEDRLPGLSPDLSPFPPCVDLNNDGTLDKSLSCLFPADPLPNILNEVPLAMQIDKWSMYFSTHERDLFGINFSPGIRGDLDLALTVVGAPTCDALTPCEGGLTCDAGTCKRRLTLSGALGTEGLVLEGRTSPVSVLDTVTIKGDPFTKYADTREGHIEVPTDPALDTLPGTVETWFRHDAAANEWQSILRHVGASGDGYEVSVGAPSRTCDPHYEGCDTGHCSLLTCENGPCANDFKVGQCSHCPEDTDPPCDTPCTSDAECIASADNPNATCVGDRPFNPDPDLLSAAKARPDFDLAGLLSSTAMACPANASGQALEDCIATGLDAAMTTLAGDELSPSCSACFAGFVTCEERAAMRVEVLRAGIVTRTVTSPPLVRAARWAHMAVTFDQATGQIGLFVDGSRAKTTDTGNLPDCDALCGCDASCTASPLAPSCSGCANELFPDAPFQEDAVESVATGCETCENNLEAWLAAAPANGRWPAPGPGATLRMGLGAPALDDVRLWSVVQTPERIAAQRASLPQDATPETLGDCSNAGPGRCAVGNARCDNDFDCETGACVGAIPSGTCRTDNDCTAAATCEDYVPPSQRWAFDETLIARYEFDYDSFQSGLDRAWNTRYRGDPEAGGLDCIATPQAPPAGTCGLIGTPCKDYDLDASYKLHGRYIDADWTTALDDTDNSGADDLHFKLNIPFGTAILSEGGVQLKGGVSVTMPDWLPAPDLLKNGGARVDVALVGIEKVQGELYAKPFDYLELGLCTASATPCATNADCSDPVFGLDDLTFCRDDGFCTEGPCLGRLTVSGYGPNGIDDGIDDGFYARTNLKAKPIPTLQAGARLSLETFATPREDLAFASYELQCPPGQSCQTAADYRLALATGLALDLPLPFASDGAGAPARLLQICGNAATFKPGKGDTLPPWLVKAGQQCPAENGNPSFGTFVDGTLNVLSQTLTGSMLVTSCGIVIRSALDLGALVIGDLELPDFGELSSEIDIRYVPFRMCAQGHLDLDIALPEVGPKLVDLEAELTADACIGEPSKYAGKDSGNFLRLLTGSVDGTPRQASLKFLAPNGGAPLFEMTGTADICFGDGDRMGQPGVRACSSDRMNVCGDLDLLDGVIEANGCLALASTDDDLTFSMRTNASLDLDGLLPSSTTELFIEMCARGQTAEWSESQGKLVCVADGNPAFKMPVPRVTLRFQSDLTVVGGSFGNVDVLLAADFSTGLFFSGRARYVAGTSTAFGFDAWAPDFCDIDVTLDVPNGQAPYLTGSTPRCSPYCFVQTDCVDASASCVLGKCQVCGDDFCAFGENSQNCPDDCGRPSGATCSVDSECASADCWTRAEQQAVLNDPAKIVDPGVCLPCNPGVSGCPAHQYCDPFQLYECRDKAPYGEFCAWNEVCQTGKCKFDTFWGGARCADCWEEGDCPSGQWCDWFTATPNPVPPGLSTAPTYQCRAPAPTEGKCGYDPILGANDDHCQPGNFCDVDGTCKAKTPNGILCTGDRICASDNCCFKGIGAFCGGCCDRTDCAANPEHGCYVSDDNALVSVCRPGRDGEACGNHQECESDNCVAGFCRTKQPNGWVGCNTQDGQCQSGHCCGNTCQQCCADADCPNDDRCYENTCRLGALGEPCDENADCASRACTASVGGVCYAPASIPNWSPCTVDGQCTLGQQCFLRGFEKLCHCYAHDHCPGGYCDLGPWGVATTDGKCGVKQPAGAYCEDDVWCQGGLVCAGNACVAPASKKNWESCTGNSECTPGNECFNGQCRCTTHAACTNDIGADSYCDMGTWLSTNEEGRCRTPKNPSNVAAYCEDGAWCESGLCTFSGRQNKNICYTPIPQPAGATCDIHQHCASGFCDPNQGYKCSAAPNSQLNWQYCTADSDCISNRCYQNRCRCLGGAECRNTFGGTSYCDNVSNWDFSPTGGKCIDTPVANNARMVCGDDFWCQQPGGVCRYSPDINVAKNVCVAPASRNWADPCDHDMQCGANPDLRCVYWPIGGALVGRPDVGIGFYCGYP